MSFFSVSEANDSLLVVGISVTLAFVVTVGICSLVVALAVACRRWSKRVPRLPATEQIYDDIPMREGKLCTTNDEPIYDTPMCERKLCMMNDTTETGSNEIPVYTAMI